MHDLNPWYCSECGDGPIAHWNPCCTACGHNCCKYCTIEHVGGPSYGSWPHSTDSSVLLEPSLAVVEQPGDDNRPDDKITKPPLNIVHDNEEQLGQQDHKVPAKEIAETSAISNNIYDGIYDGTRSEDDHAQTAIDAQPSPSNIPIQPDFLLNHTAEAESIHQDRQDAGSRMKRPWYTSKVDPYRALLNDKTSPDTPFTSSSEEQTEDLDATVRQIEHAEFELEEVDSGEPRNGRIEVVQTDHYEGHGSHTVEEVGMIDQMKDLHISDNSTDEKIKERILSRKKKRSSTGVFMRTISRSVEGDSDYPDDGPQDDEARRLHRKIRGPGFWDNRRSLVSEDEGFPNTENVAEIEEPDNLVVQHKKGLSPSIASDDALTLDELPFWSGQNEDLFVESDLEWSMHSAHAQPETEMSTAGIRPLPWVHQTPPTEDSFEAPASLSASPLEPLTVSHIEKGALAPLTTQENQGLMSNIDDEDDRQSVQSLESSTTLISTLSGFTVVELESATVELQRIFQEDPDLVRLYRQAIKDTAIGPERFQRNVVRLLKLFAQDLRCEASKELEKMTSRFVSMKARYIAQCVIEEFHDRPIDPKPRQAKKHQYVIDGDRYEVNEDHDEIDDSDELAPVDEDYFEDLPTLRTFLVNSSAFRIFREELTRFVLPKQLRPYTIQSAEPTKEAATIDPSLLNCWHLFSSTALAFKALLVAAGYLEPPLQPGMIRLRWQCRCGDSLFGDVREYRHGGIDMLVKRMQRSGAGKVTATSYNTGVSSQQYIFEPTRWIRLATRKVTDAFARLLDRQDSSLQHSRSDSAAKATVTYINMPPLRVLHLLACMHQTHRIKCLVQDRIEMIANDRELFYFIQKQLNQLHTQIWTFLHMRKVTTIHFTKFRLRMGNSVEIRPHDSCCRPDVCDCIPIAGNIEYECKPAGPLDTGPPIMPQEMMHWLYHPHLIDERERSVLNQLPKRMCGQLQATGDEPAEGWGLYYEEGLNIFLIINLIVGISILASLLFGILWTVLRSDIQGAWGVSSWIVTTSTLVVALLIARAKNE